MLIDNIKYKKSLIEVFSGHIDKSDYIAGSSVLKFEKKFSKINNSKYCISCANGSDALQIALKALNVKPGDEVITTSLSWVATSASITSVGAKVIFCDIEKNGFNIDVELIKKKITKKTVGIIPVHLYGYPAQIFDLKKIAKKYNLWIIEDCAQAHLAEIRGKKVGNFGKFGTFSFFPGKNLGALGDAGCLVTNNKVLANKAKLIANHGGKGLHILEGINSRLDSIQASFLNLKILDLKKNTKKRIKIANIYQKNLNNNIILPNLKKNHVNVFHQYVIRVKKRNRLINYLKKNKIDTQIHYKRILPLLKAYKYLNLKRKDFINSYRASKEILSLPISPEMSKKKIIKICNLINNFYD